jgi:hypothetical protein
MNLPTDSAEEAKFLREIVDTRLELCGYEGRVADVIGNSDYAPGVGGAGLARALKREADARAEARERRRGKAPPAAVEKEVEAEIEQKNVKAYYHGWETICRLCTGDVSNVLEVMARLYEQCNVGETTKSRVPPAHQDEVIQSYAFQYMNKIKGIPGCGERLFAIANAFGNMAARLLREVPLIARGKARSDPYQLLRIELDEGYVQATHAALEQNTAWGEKRRERREDALSLWKLLQRHCIFVDAEEGRSRRNTLAGKVILRRIFCPAFRMSLVNSESYTIDQANWEAFCSDPKGEAERYVSTVLHEDARAAEARQLPLGLPGRREGS